jgi:hypothetical protein
MSGLIGGPRRRLHAFDLRSTAPEVMVSFPLQPVVLGRRAASTWKALMKASTQAGCGDLAAAAQPCRPRRYPARRVAGRLLPGPVRHRLSSRFPRSYVTPIPPALLLLRLLVLRVALPS